MRASSQTTFLCERLKPSVVFQVCDEALFSLRTHENGRLVACGSQQGAAAILEVCSGLSNLQKNEKSLMAEVRTSKSNIFFAIKKIIGTLTSLNKVF